MVLVGTSLGSAVAVHFAREHPEAVAKLVFAGPQVYVDGIGPMSSMPRALSYLGVQVRPASRNTLVNHAMPPGKFMVVCCQCRVTNM